MRITFSAGLELAATFFLVAFPIAVGMVAYSLERAAKAIEGLTVEEKREHHP